MKKFSAVTAAIAAFALAFATTTFAWFSARNVVTFPQSFGSTQAAYFADGDGSRESPYLISSPVHLYNLAWLQYLGYFNLRDDFNNGRAQNYFKLKNSVSCAGLALPPIGTEEYPFIGYFDGNCKTITNVLSSNSESDLTRRPSNAEFSGGVLRSTDKAADTTVVGLFGVVGDYQSFVENNYPSGYAKDTFDDPKEPTTSGSTDFYFSEMKVENFYVDKLSVKSKTTTTLVGLIAGYVRGTVQNAGVYECDVTLNQNAKGLDGSSVVSKYSIVGDYDESVVGWEEKPTGADGGEQGDGAAWGGSIDMRALFDDRMSSYYSSKDSNYHYYNSSNPQNGSVWFNRSTNETLYYLDGGYKSTDSYPISGENVTYIPLNVGEDGFTPSSSNTGYISSGYKGENGSGAARIKKNALSSTVYHVKESFTGTYSASTKMKIYTKTAKTGGAEKIIKDHTYANDSGADLMTPTELGLTQYEIAYKDENESTKYKGTRWVGLHELLLNQSYVYGLHFMKSTSGEEISKDKVFVARKVSINGAEYENYQMTTKSIDCYIAQRGYINFFASTNYYNTTAQNFFSLHEIKRSDDKKTIVSVREIKQIYKNKDSGGYAYSYESDSTGFDEGKYELVFDTSWITSTAAKKNAIYYFEIPVNAGEYALGACAEGTGAYLMYLDIGANGDGSGESGTTPDVQKENYNITTVDFVSAATGSSDFGVPTSDGVARFPFYKDVAFSIESGSAVEGRVWYKRENYDPSLLPTTVDNQIETKVAYRFLNVVVNPVPSNLAKEDETLGQNA